MLACLAVHATVLVRNAHLQFQHNTTPVAIIAMDGRGRRGCASMKVFLNSTYQAGNDAQHPNTTRSWLESLEPAGGLDRIWT
jgi:hypothetical protein